MKETDKKRLEKALLKIESSRNVSDYEVALLMRETIAAAGDARELMHFLCVRVGLEKSKANRYVAKGNALEVVSDKGVWSRIGWDGVAWLVRIESDEKRAAATREIARQSASRGGVLADGTVQKIVKKFMPQKSNVSPVRLERTHPAKQLAEVATWFRERASIEGGFVRMRVAVSAVPGTVIEALGLDNMITTPKPKAVASK